MKLVLLTLLCALSALAQWPTSPSENLLICNHAGEQALPKIAALSEGGCYIAWLDHASGNYDIYLQRLDAEGVPQWTDPCGILISDHPQSTSLTDWDIAVDAADNCIIAINDIRNGDDRDITVYNIGPQQEFVWGADGITISTNDGFEPDPRIVAMREGDVVFAWQEENVIHLRRLNSEGSDVFTPQTITITHANPLSIPRICEADDGSVILSYLIQQGTGFGAPRHIYLQKFSATGQLLWQDGGIPVMTTNGIGIQMRPDVIHDGAGGAYSFWYDTRNNVHHVFVQHLNNDGNPLMQENGIQVDLSAAELQMSPSAVLAEDGIVVFYQITNTNQSQGGVQAQKLEPTGNFLWNTAGITITPLSTEPCFNVRAFNQGDNFGVFYSQYAQGSAINTVLRASQLGPTGDPTWTPTITDLCNVNSEKGRPFACVNSFNQIIAAWPDSRTATMDIYVQNVNSDGTLGPNPILPPAITIVSPEEDEIVNEAEIDLVFEVENYIIHPDFGDGYVLIQINDQDPELTNWVQPYPVTLHQGENTIIVEIVDLEFLPLEPRVMDSVHFSYVETFPSIMITAPQPGLLIDSVTISFVVSDFVVAETGGDGFVRLEFIPVQGGDTYSADYFDAEPIFVQFIEIGVYGQYFLALTLVDNSGEPLVPSVGDTILVSTTTTDVDALPASVPTSFSISSAYPNPFNSTLTIQYDVPNQASISLGVYDLLGRNVTTLFEGTREPGRHTLQWHAEGAVSGVYFIRLNSQYVSQTHKTLLLK